jgi:hypothetical protein
MNGSSLKITNKKAGGSLFTCVKELWIFFHYQNHIFPKERFQLTLLSCEGCTIILGYFIKIDSHAVEG